MTVEDTAPSLQVTGKFVMNHGFKVFSVHWGRNEKKRNLRLFLTHNNTEIWLNSLYFILRNGFINNRPKKAVNANRVLSSGVSNINILKFSKGKL